MTRAGRPVIISASRRNLRPHSTVHSPSFSDFLLSTPGRQCYSVFALTPLPPLPILGEGEPTKALGARPPSPRIGRGGRGVRAEPAPSCGRHRSLFLNLKEDGAMVDRVR